jgi:hypothetical protein
MRKILMISVPRASRRDSTHDAFERKCDAALQTATHLDRIVGVVLIDPMSSSQCGPAVMEHARRGYRAMPHAFLISPFQLAPWRVGDFAQPIFQLASGKTVGIDTSVVPTGG